MWHTGDLVDARAVVLEVAADGQRAGLLVDAEVVHRLVVPDDLVADLRDGEMLICLNLLLLYVQDVDCLAL